MDVLGCRCGTVAASHLRALPFVLRRCLAVVMCQQTLRCQYMHLRDGRVASPLSLDIPCLHCSPMSMSDIGFSSVSTQTSFDTNRFTCMHRTFQFPLWLVQSLDGHGTCPSLGGGLTSYDIARTKVGVWLRFMSLGGWYRRTISVLGKEGGEGLQALICWLKLIECPKRRYCTDVLLK